MAFSRAVRVFAVVAGSAIVVGSVVASAAAVSVQPTIVERDTHASPHGTVVVAIGDSIMEGHGLEAAQAWPALLAARYGWRLTNLASDGSGFVTVGDDGDTFADQAAVAIRLHPSIVIVSGSSNDLGDSDEAIEVKTDETIDALRSALPKATIIAVSPVWNDTAEPAQLKTIGADVVRAARMVHARDIEIGQPLYERSSLMQSDDVHPTAAGQRLIASAVEAALNG